MLGIDLSGQRALVTGGSRGVGRATALLLARAGADVVITYRTRARDADAVVAELTSLGVRAFAHACDLSEPDAVDGLFDRVASEFTALDLYIGNAGIWPSQDTPLSEMRGAQWRSTMAVNLDSMFLTLRRAIPLLADGGRIVLVSSTAGQRGEVGHADYAASKGAVISLVKSLSGELAARDITVNAVAPGWIDTEMVADAISPDRTAIERAIPIGRIASADDVAGPIVFLCSRLARHITGEVVNVNGGSVLCG